MLSVILKVISVLLGVAGAVVSAIEGNTFVEFCGFLLAGFIGYELAEIIKQIKKH